MTVTTEDLVPIGPLQDAYVRVVQAEILSESEIAQTIGFSTPKGKGDTTRLQRTVGLYPRRDKARTYATEIPYDMAVKIARAMGVDPVDVDL